MYISDELVELIKLAQGTRSLNRFAKDCDVSAGNLSKILRKVNTSLPSLTTLHKISMNACNDVSLIDLMTATGYLSETPNTKRINERIAEEGIKITKETKKYKKILLSNAEHLIFDDGTPVSQEVLNDYLETLDITLGIFKIKNKKALKSQNDD